MANSSSKGLVIPTFIRSMGRSILSDAKRLDMKFCVLFCGVFGWCVFLCVCVWGGGWWLGGWMGLEGYVEVLFYVCVCVCVCVCVWRGVGRVVVGVMGVQA
jgi:hypothetical protein